MQNAADSPQTPSVGRRILQLSRESAVYGSAAVLTKAVGVFLVPLYTRVFSPEDYGTLSLVGAISGFLGILFVLGLDSASARWYYDTSDEAKQKQVIASWFWCQLTVSLVGGAVLAAVAPYVSEWLTGTADCVLLIRLAALVVPLRTFQRVLTNLFRLQRRPYASAGFALAVSLVQISLTVLLVLVLHKGVTGVYIALAIVLGLAAVAALVIARDWLRPRMFSGGTLRQMLRYGLPLIPAGLAVWVTRSSDRLVIKHFCDSGELGLYAVAASLASVLGLVVHAFQMAWAPFALSIHSQPNSDRVYAKVLELYTWGGCVLASCLALFSPLALRLLATTRYYAAESCLTFLAFGILLAGVRHIAAIGPTIAKRPGPIAVSVFIQALTNLALNVILVPRWGRDGAAAATTIAGAVSAAYLFWTSRRIYPIPFRLSRIAVFSASALCAVLTVRAFLPAEGIFSYGMRTLALLAIVTAGFALGFGDLLYSAGGERERLGLPAKSSTGGGTPDA